MAYSYIFERVTAELGGWGPLSGNNYQMGDYQSVIIRRAADGWRYVGFLPAVQRGTGHIEELDLVFEKEET